MEPLSCGNSQGRPITRSKIRKDVYENKESNRPLWETKPKIGDGFILRADDNPNRDLDDETTLKQLRKRFSTKKREHTRSDEKKAVDDESDLNEPLISLKPKRSKTSKSQRKRINFSVASSSSADSANKLNKNLVFEVLDPVIHVKVEIPEPEQSGYQNKTPASDEGLNHNGTVTDRFQNMVLCEYREPLICGHEYQECVNNLVEDVEPISMLVPSDGTRSNLELLGIECQEFLDLPPLAIQKPNEHQNSNVCIYSRSSSIIEDMYSSDNGPQEELNYAPFEDKIEIDCPFEIEDYSSSQDKNCDSPTGSSVSFEIGDIVLPKEDTIADKEQHSTCLSEGHIEGELLNAKENQTSVVPINDGENQCSLENQTLDTADIISTPEAHLSPENLTSTRKIISPSSEERLCLAMGSVEIWNGADQSKCNEKLFEEQTTNKNSSLGSAVKYDKATVNHRRSEKVRQRKAIISPRHNINKSQIPKGNLEGPRFSRTIPNLSTECASIQSCSESAVAFSTQQMHDMESLAVKLMNELKSMKDIVEQKLLFEAYRNVSLKNDADEVKSAIKNASKVEESSRKWLSVMSRDCNRFCKIMKMTPNNSTFTQKGKETRKIMFADEAGGELCRIKFFEEGTKSDGVKQ